MKNQIIGVLRGSNKASQEKQHDTVFNALLQSDLPPEETSLTRLQHEAISLVGAGLETTKWALTVGSFHILDNLPVLQRLREELVSAIPDTSSPPSLEKLEKLPYLSACIEEGNPPHFHLRFRKRAFLTFSTTPQPSASPTAPRSARRAPARTRRSSTTTGASRPAPSSA